MYTTYPHELKKFIDKLYDEWAKEYKRDFMIGPCHFDDNSICEACDYNSTHPRECIYYQETDLFCTDDECFAINKLKPIALRKSHEGYYYCPECGTVYAKNKDDLIKRILIDFLKALTDKEELVRFLEEAGYEKYLEHCFNMYKKSFNEKDF